MKLARSQKYQTVFNSLRLQFSQFQNFAPVLQLQTALFLGLAIQCVPQIFKLRLEQHLDIGHFTGDHLLRRMQFLCQFGVLRLQVLDAVDICGQTVVQVLQLVFFLYAAEPGWAQRRRPFAYALLAVGRTSRRLIRLRRVPGHAAFSRRSLRHCNALQLLAMAFSGGSHKTRGKNKTKHKYYYIDVCAFTIIISITFDICCTQNKKLKNMHQLVRRILIVVDRLFNRTPDKVNGTHKNLNGGRKPHAYDGTPTRS